MYVKSMVCLVGALVAVPVSAETPKAKGETKVEHKADTKDTKVEAPQAAGEKAPAMDMMKMGPATRKVTHPDKAGVEALYKATAEAEKKGDINALADLHDFPITMSTDDAKGTFSQESWGREQFIKTMAPFLTMPKSVKQTEKHTVYFLSNDLASVEQDTTLTSGKEKATYHSTSLVVKKGGSWKWKAGVEAGWGDMMPPSSGTGGSTPTP